jgi:hypothetical protein
MRFMVAMLGRVEFEMVGIDGASPRLVPVR